MNTPLYPPLLYKNESERILCMEAQAKRDRLWKSQSPTPLKTQVGGTHYSKLAIQPVDYITKNDLGFCEGSVVKYVTRWKDKGGIADLEKAKHFIDILIAQTLEGNQNELTKQSQPLKVSSDNC